METGESGMQMTIRHKVIQGVFEAVADAAVNSDTSSALDLVRAIDFSENLHE